MRFCEEPGSELWNFHKGHLPEGFFRDCDVPLLAAPPDDFITVQKTLLGTHGAFLVCRITWELNRAATEFKTKYCPGARFNKKKCVRIRFEHQSAVEKTWGTKLNPMKWPLARLADECVED